MSTHPLCGKTFYFLGSSVTYGEPDGVSFVEHLARRTGCHCIKNAVSGTTLADTGAASYVRRLAAHAQTLPPPDHFLCQLSTNDAGQNLPLGRLSDSMRQEAFDQTTILGAIEWINAHLRAVWGCPISFYTNTRFDSPLYAQMVDALFEAQRKWGFGILDLWHLPDPPDAYKNDPVHPSARGYEAWWTPRFEEYLSDASQE